MHDPVCAGCNNIANCPKPCPPVQWIDGNQSRREPLLRDMAVDNDRTPVAARDYNRVIADVLRARRGRIEDIRAIDNIRIRAIAALAYAGISQHQIARLLHVSGKTLRRLIVTPPKSPQS